MNHEADDAMGITAQYQRHTRRRLSDKILIAFHQARDLGGPRGGGAASVHLGHYGRGYAAAACAAWQRVSAHPGERCRSA
jgi:hypothetical protein